MGEERTSLGLEFPLLCSPALPWLGLLLTEGMHVVGGGGLGVCACACVSMCVCLKYKKKGAWLHPAARGWPGSVRASSLQAGTVGTGGGRGEELL